MNGRVYIFAIMPCWWLAASCQTCHLAYVERWNMACGLHQPQLTVSDCRVRSLLQVDTQQKHHRATREIQKRVRWMGEYFISPSCSFIKKKKNQNTQNLKTCSHNPSFIKAGIFTRPSHVGPCNNEWTLFFEALSLFSFISHVQLHWLCIQLWALSKFF